MRPGFQLQDWVCRFQVPTCVLVLVISSPTPVIVVGGENRKQEMHALYQRRIQSWMVLASWKGDEHPRSHNLRQTLQTLVIHDIPKS